MPATTTARRPPADLAPLFAGVLRSEARKLATVRSTTWALLAAVTFNVITAALLGALLPGHLSAHQKATIDSDEPLRADGMVEAYRALRADGGVTLDDADYRYTDCNGEQYGFKNDRLAFARTVRKLKARSKRGAKYYPAALTTPKQRPKSNLSTSSKS